MALVTCSASTSLPHIASVNTFLIWWSKGVKGNLFGVSVSANFLWGSTQFWALRWIVSTIALCFGIFGPFGL